MENRTWLYNAFFKAQDRFLAYEMESGFEPEVIYDYIHCARLLASHHYQGAKEQNFLLCELFLRQIYFHFLDAIQDPTRSRIFRRVCLDSIYILLMELNKCYQQVDNGELRLRQLKQQLQRIQAPLD
ncbi:hypothetical protein N0382_002193 [Vibrio cholerae]|nr:hypothetical protein [Vibrio cholerae]EGR0525425.1 hypothetical protein [Vibrio cholerae]EGR0601224.1 hypothetical protein [Vibrio cholerae]EGR1109144.1 hypothetical protein [Vibrio cholerae]EGR2017342.1 hypothetical protein [Vibrio cholerae]